MTSNTDHDQLPGWLVAPFLLGSTAALAGGFWDDAWHTERGRDSFFIAPHIAIYSGITVAGIALALWAMLAIRRGGVRAALSRRPLALALLSVAVTLASAPVDNFWHVAFGRDAVIWSPPHVLGIVGTAGLATAVLVELTRRRAGWAAPLRWVAGALMLAAFSFLVVEYDTDVPQFSALWYLPVLALASSFALGLIRLATRDAFAATRAAAVHLAFFGAVAAFLSVEGFDTPKLPVIVFAAVVLDLGARRGWPRAVQAGAYVAALYAAYVPALALFGSGVRLTVADVLIGLPLSFAVVFAVLSVIFGSRPRVPRLGRVAVAGLMAVTLTLAAAAPALAHDPGQGKPAGTFDFVAALDGRTLRLQAQRNGRDCARLDPVGVVARRAGTTVRGPLTHAGCDLRGSVRLNATGRWFVYLDTRRGAQTIESWLPVKVGEGETTFTAPGRFAYLADRKPSSTAKLVIGAIMYALVLAFLTAIVALVRVADPARAAAHPG